LASVFPPFRKNPQEEQRQEHDLQHWVADGMLTLFALISAEVPLPSPLPYTAITSKKYVRCTFFELGCKLPFKTCRYLPQTDKEFL
jgi:hypothetical protein